MRQSKFPKNVFHEPISDLRWELILLEWSFPYVQCIALTMAILIPLTMQIMLYPSIGVTIQIQNYLLLTIEEIKQKISRAGAIEEIGHWVSIGIFYLLTIPFWIINSPFYFMSGVLRKLFPITKIKTELKQQPKIEKSELKPSEVSRESKIAIQTLINSIPCQFTYQYNDVKNWPSMKN